MTDEKRDRDCDTAALKRLAAAIPGARVATDDAGLSKLRIPIQPRD
jgi:hypothetical protein